MIAIGVVLLLGLAIFAGLYWQLRSVLGYLTAVALTLGLWGAAYGLRQSYAGVLPGLAGMTASLLLGLVGGRAVGRAGSGDDGSRWLWLLGTALVVAPLVAVLCLWLLAVG